MIKKRRDFDNDIEIDLRENGKSITETISTVIETIKNNDVTYTKRKISSKYGKGYIDFYKTQNITLSVCEYQLSNDLIFYKSLREEIIHMDFLLEGEKIITNKIGEEILLESRESFMADIEGFKSYTKMFSAKPFKEIKIRIHKSFLLGSGLLTEAQELKKITDENLVLPITDDLLSILIQIEKYNIEGIANKAYLQAKVLEFLALKISNYGHQKVYKVGDKKILKQIYLVKQIIKSNLDKNYSLVELTDKIGINSTEFNKEFIRINKCSLYEFSIVEKMKHAKYLLENTEVMIYLIAEEIGYKNATHFTTAFKRIYNITPLNYRKYKNRQNRS